MFKLAVDRNDRTTRVVDFIEYDKIARQIQPRPGLTFNPDATLTPTPANIDNEGHYYFDKSASQRVAEGRGIGFHGDSDYANNYGAYLVGQAIDIERRHVAPGPDGAQSPIRVDLQALRLREDLMERDGLPITVHPEKRQPYIDGSEQLPQPQRYFDNTDTPAGTAHSHEYVPVQPGMNADQNVRETAAHNAPDFTSQNNLREREESSALRLDPDLQRIYDAALTGDTALIDAAMEQCAQAYLATPQGQAFMAESQAAAQVLIEQEEREWAQERARAKYFPAEHRDRALFDAIQERLPEGTPDRVTANVMLEAKQRGIRKPGDIEQVQVLEDDRVWVQGRIPGFECVTDLTHKPPLAQTLQQIDTLNQQQDAQRQQWEQERAQQQGMGMSR